MNRRSKSTALVSGRKVGRRIPPAGYFFLGMLTATAIIVCGWLFWLYWWIYTPAYQMPLSWISYAEVIYDGHRVAFWVDAERMEQLQSAIPWYTGGIPYDTGCFDGSRGLLRLHEHGKRFFDICLPVSDCVAISPQCANFPNGYWVRAPEFLRLLGTWLLAEAGDDPLKKYPYLSKREISRWHDWVAAID